MGWIRHAARMDDAMLDSREELKQREMWQAYAELESVRRTIGDQGEARATLTPHAEKC